MDWYYLVDYYYRISEGSVVLRRPKTRGDHTLQECVYIRGFLLVLNEFVITVKSRISPYPTTTLISDDFFLTYLVSQKILSLN